VPEFNETALLPLSEDHLPSIEVSNPAASPWVTINADQTYFSSFWVSPQGALTSRLSSTWLNVFSNNRPIQLSHMIEAASVKDETIAQLEAENARLRASLEMRDQI